MNQVDNQPSIAGIGCRTEDTGRLVDDVVGMRLGAQKLSIYLNMVGIEISLGAQLSHNGSIDRHSSLKDELLGLTP